MNSLLSFGISFLVHCLIAVLAWRVLPLGVAWTLFVAVAFSFVFTLFLGSIRREARAIVVGAVVAGLLATFVNLMIGWVVTHPVDPDLTFRQFLEDISHMGWVSWMLVFSLPAAFLAAALLGATLSTRDAKANAT